MTCRHEFTDLNRWRFCPDSLPAGSARMRSILRARLVDELNGSPIADGVSLTTSMPDLHPRMATGGLVGLVGHPARLFPTLDVDGVLLTLEISAQGFNPLSLEALLGPMPGFPASFASLDLGDVNLHRKPVELSGRTVQRNGLSHQVVAGATVAIVGYWPRIPQANVNAAAVMEPPHLLSLDPPLYAQRDLGVSTIRRREPTAVAGADKTLLVPVVSGERRLRLSDRIGLTINGLVTVDATDPDCLEHLLISDIDSSSSSDQPSWVTLAHPLAYGHRKGAQCQPANLGLPGPFIALAREAIRGDVTIFPSTLTGLGDRITVEIDSGLGPAEYHRARLYRVDSDAGGFFRLPPLHRVAMILIHAERLGLTSPNDERYAPSNSRSDQNLTVSFPP